MADQRNGGIAWCEETWNPVRGCSRVSEGCRHCYAERVAARFSGPGKPYEGLAVMKSDGPHWTGKVRLVAAALDLPLRWRKPRRIFVNSMSDLFHKGLTDHEILKVFVTMARARQHTFQILTKQPRRMLEWFLVCADDTVRPLAWAGVPWPLPNVWLGVSVEDQETADERIPLLLQTPAAVRWVSAEPLLGPIEFPTMLRNWIDWLVVGGESGPGARPMHPDWARGLRDQCVAAGVPFFMKQGSKANWSDFKNFESFPADLRIREYPDAR